MRDLMLLELYRIAIGQLWSLVQWWASVSFGLIALGHFASKKLNLAFVIVLTVLYTSFSAYFLGNTGSMVLEIRGYRDELMLLMNAGELGPAGIAFLENYGSTSVTVIGFIVALFGTFLGTVGFLIYSYRRTRTP